MQQYCWWCEWNKQIKCNNKQNKNEGNLEKIFIGSKKDDKAADDKADDEADDKTDE